MVLGALSVAPCLLLAGPDVGAAGHLVSLLGSAGTSSTVESVVDMAGPSDLLTMGDRGDAVLVSAEFRRLLGSVATADLTAALQAASPVRYVKAGDPPFLDVQSTNDTVVYPRQALELAWDLAANGVPHQLLMVHAGGHAFDDPGAAPTEAQVTKLVVWYFLETLVFHSTAGLADGSGSR